MSRAVIQQVAQLLRQPDRWCQGALAKDAKGYPCKPEKGEQWDALGAAYKVTGTSLKSSDIPKGLGSAVAAMNLAAQMKHRMSIELVNDRLGHAAVIEVLRQAWAMSAAKSDEDEDQ